MPELASERVAAPRKARRQFVARLRGRTVEIQKAVLAAIFALPDGRLSDDPEYQAGLTETVAAVLDYAIDSISVGDDVDTPIPPAAATQAHRAARLDVPLDRVLRRYVAGHQIFHEFVLSEAADLPDEVLQQVLRMHAARTDLLLAAVAEEHLRERRRISRSSARRLRERVERLLAGRAIDVSELNYQLERWHVGLAIWGEDAEETVRTLARDLDCTLLSVPRQPEIYWAWLGSPRPLDTEQMEAAIGEAPRRVYLSHGEPRYGTNGWRLTHYEACAGVRVSLHRPRTFVRGGDEVILAALLRDRTLATCIEESYVLPLQDKDDGRVLRQTLREYFRAGNNAATAAAALGVDRHTVRRRLHKIEERVGRPVHLCHAELEIALGLAELRDGGSPASPPPDEFGRPK